MPTSGMVLTEVSAPGLPRRRPIMLWGAALAVVVLIGIAYAESLAYLVTQWMEDDNFSHGFFVPVITVALIWLRREQVVAAGMVPSWWGLGPAVLGLALYLVGELATIYFLQHLSLWLVIVGLALAVAGPCATREMAFPLGYLLTMIPPPQMLLQSLSSSLQLMSSTLGVGFLQLIGVTAFREGNVIDLGPIQLQVVEACSGLRYLIPLIALTLLSAYLFQSRLWKRVVLVASAIPLAVLLNGLRIGLIGVLVERFGQSAAEGFMHAFEGWFLFVLSLAILGAEMWLLERVGAGSAPGVDRPAARPGAVLSPGPAALVVSGPVFACIGLLAVTTSMSFHADGRDHVPPPRQNFVDFPMQVAGWQGEPMVMERQYVDVLRFDDYLLANYQGPGGPINVYAAYYRSQEKGRATHSPKTCIPGGGWEITSLDEVVVPGDVLAGSGFRANRVMIQKGEQKQVVLYWFKQRHRVVTSEYLVKFFLFVDALTMKRTDGALIRLVAAVQSGESEKAADQRVMQMAAAVQPLLPAYVPD
ncbi:MAG: VPLPA-CTERM-specific exosortase XrtD [Nitrospira sp.]|nr:VPLPA-CTERM-specific exosortase XrtD [Nitrospira sp.]